MNTGQSAIPEELRVVEEFCNSATLLHGADALVTMSGGREWLARHGWDGEFTLVHLVALRDAREILRTFLADRTDRSARLELNRLAQEHWRSPRVDDDGRLALSPSAQPVSPAGAAVGALLLHGLTGSGLRLRTCASDACRWVFYDSSRSRTRTWCDMNTCGARSKMRQYRDRLA